MKKALLSLLLCVIVFTSVGQNGLGYYYDYSGRFIIFDKGNTFQLENTHVDSVRVGNEYIAYIDKQSNLKIYYNNETQIIEESSPTIIVATANALVYKMEQRLMMFQNGKKTQLASWADNFTASDSIIIWQARPSLDIMIYENGVIKTIEAASSLIVIKEGRVGNNVFAYSDLSNDFKIYYHGQVKETQSSDIRDFKCGKDIVAYIDRFNSSFNVFDNGDVKTISNRLPKHYSVSDNMVTYLDADNNFMVYYKGESTKLESYEPAVYQSQNNVMIYYYKPELKLFYKGKLFILEKTLQKQDAVLGVNSVLYMDDLKTVKYFYKGKKYDNILKGQSTKLELYRDLPVLRYANTMIGFYYQGKLYEYRTSIY